MMRARRKSGVRLAQGGFSLAEVLVSMVILALAASVALILYDAARKAFKVGENVAEQQQGIRIAYDMLLSELRMAGYNHNPNGDSSRPDEQVEAAYERALVIRADFDAEDSAAALDPEETLAASPSPFRIVTTGNDEIVAYVLAKPDDSSSDILSFEADLSAPRTGVVSTVSIDRVALSHDDPPYTLFKVSLDAGGNPAPRPVIENVRSLRFVYYDAAGNIVPAVGGAEDDEDRWTRASIRRIGVEIQGLTRDPDPNWVDVRDTDPATRSYRKFMLSGDVTPRNLGRFGLRDLEADSTPPATPPAPQLHPGHCKGLYVTWPPNQAEDEVTYYRIRYGIVPGPLDSMRAAIQPETYLGELQDAEQYDVTVEAVDRSGNVSSPSPASRATTQNMNTPKAPLGLAGTSDRNGTVDLSWEVATENVEAIPAADPLTPRLRDLARYRLYRGATSGFTPGPANRIADLPAMATPVHTDSPVVNCRQYFYKVTAVDACDREGPPSGAAPGQGFSAVAPVAPRNVEAFRGQGSGTHVKWGTVREDVLDNPIAIDKYSVFSTGVRDSTYTPVVPDDFVLVATATGATEFDDSLVVPGGQTVFYMVTALDDCVNESAFSEVARLQDCTFSGDVVIQQPAYGLTVSGNVDLAVAVVNGTGTYIKLTLGLLHEPSGIVTIEELFQPGPSWTYTWQTAFFTPGPYRVSAAAEQDGACFQSESIRLFVVAP